MAASRVAQAQAIALKAATQARAGADAAARAADRLRAALRSRRRARLARRPDGTLVSPSPTAVAPLRNGASVSPVAAPFIRARDALRERWQDAVREGKLAAREKEEAIRAGYESRVQHRAAWHAQQRQNRK